MTNRIYMDYHATTPVDPRVLEVMLPYFTDRFGNAASTNHSLGWQAEKAVDHARSQVAKLIGAESVEITFTSGATESNNLAIAGVAERYRQKGKHIITQATEHSAVLDPLRKLERDGYDITVLPVNEYGVIDLKELEKALRDDTILVSIMAANNEVGALMPVSAIGKMCHERGVLYHCDAVQACGRMPIDVQSQGIDLLSISAHKFYGPKGVGALYARRKKPRVSLMPQMLGGGHERGNRSGTLNVPGIVGMGEAANCILQDLDEDILRLQTLGSLLADKLRQGIPEAQVNGPLENRLPGNWNISIPGVGAEKLILAMRNLCISSGAACASAQQGPSHVLKAMGLSDQRCHGSLRFGLGRFTTEKEVLSAAAQVASAVQQIRSSEAGTN